MDSPGGLYSRRLFLTTGLAATTMAAEPQRAAEQPSAPLVSEFELSYLLRVTR